MICSGPSAKQRAIDVQVPDFVIVGVNKKCTVARRYSTADSSARKMPNAGGQAPVTGARLAGLG